MIPSTGSGYKTLVSAPVLRSVTNELEVAYSTHPSYPSNSIEFVDMPMLEIIGSYLRVYYAVALKRINLPNLVSVGVGGLVGVGVVGHAEHALDLRRREDLEPLPREQPVALDDAGVAAHEGLSIRRVGRSSPRGPRHTYVGTRA